MLPSLEFYMVNEITIGNIMLGIQKMLNECNFPVLAHEVLLHGSLSNQISSSEPQIQR